MNRYRCIAEVTARPIAQVGWYDQLEAYKLVFDDGRMMTTATFTSDETPDIGDYYIEHDDGSCEVVAKDVFEREYVLTTGQPIDTAAAAE